MRHHLYSLTAAQQGFVDHVCTIVAERDSTIEKLSAHCSHLTAVQAQLQRAFTDKVQELRSVKLNYEGRRAASISAVAVEHELEDRTGNTVSDLRQVVASLSERCHAAESLLESIGYVCTSGEWKSSKRQSKRRKRVAVDD